MKREEKEQQTIINNKIHAMLYYYDKLNNKLEHLYSKDEKEHHLNSFNRLKNELEQIGHNIDNILKHADFSIFK